MRSLCAFLVLFPGLVFGGADPIDRHPEWDQEYSAKIREYTTGPEFMTDLVDHLPSSDRIPSPLRFLGYVAGAADRLTYATEIHKYMRALAAASSRVKVFSLGKTDAGREMILVAIADEETIQDLDRYKEITRKLADPRRCSEEEAAALFATGKPMYYVTGGLHSYETGSPEMLMELAYRLAVEETPAIQQIRSSIITLITPVLEVDGHERMVDIVRWYQANPAAGMPPLVYWGNYVAHDNNRDAIAMALTLTRNLAKAFMDWHPQVMHDLHESIPFLYISTGTGPYNAWLDPIVIGEWQRMADQEVQALTEKGLPGVWTHGFFDGWAPNYLFWIANGHNAVGRFYETFGNGIPSTQDRVVREQSNRAWFRPNPPLPKVKWSLRNNVNYQQSGVLVALQECAKNREELLRRFFLLGKRSVAKATTEGPAAYVFEAKQKRLGQLRDLLNLLRSHGIEVHQADAGFSVKLGWPPEKKDEAEKPEAKKGCPEETKKQEDIAKFSAGSFIIRLDQPYSRMADALLDTQYVRGEERVYDDTGWTLGYLHNVDFKRIVNQDVLKVAMRAWDGNPQTPAVPAKSIALIVRNTADTDLVRLRYALPDAEFTVAEEEFKTAATTWPVGTIVLSLDGVDRDRLRSAIASTRLDLTAVEMLPPLKLHDMPLPRIAFVHTWINTQDEGWYRLAFESLGVPYEYVSTQDVAAEMNLRGRFDVIVFPPAGADPEMVVNGLPAGPPIPWRKSELTPNLGVDETDDIRPGLGLSGVQNMARFVEEGGLLIATGESAEWAVRYGLARWVKVAEPEKLRARGSILLANVTDRNSPVSFGYDDTVPVYFSGAPVFKVGVSEMEWMRRRDQGRPSGRGSKTDPDVPQGRPFVELPEKPKPGPGEEGFQLPEDFRVFVEPFYPKIEERPRVILSFAKEPEKLLLSGMLEGAEDLAGTPALIDCPRGKGHILLFANNPMWRMVTPGSYALMFNAILNYQHLGLGWPPPKPEKKEGTTR